MISSPAYRPGRPMTAADQCDRCGARASVLAELHSGGTLLFCGHHARVHHAALQRVAHCFQDPARRSLHAAA